MTTFAIRGVIEGFYGRPWSWTERDRMVDFLGDHGYNLYIYAPKNDPIHRNRWLEPYLPEELERFGRLARRCQERGLQFAFGLSPLKFHYSSEAEWAALWARLGALYEQGVRSFTILLDDMPDKFAYPDDEEMLGTVADAHVWLTNRVWERLQAMGGVERLLFVPTEYCGEGRSPYLETLGTGLRPEVEIFWTGSEVCAQYLKTDEARVISETLRRPVLYWDNYPVNDLEMRWRPHLRPVRGRDADLHSVARGIVANGSLQPEACKIPLHTYAAYMADPAGYEPEAAWQRALLEICGDAVDAAAVAILGDMTRWAAIERGQALHNQLAPKLHRFWQAWGAPPALAGPDLPDQLPVGQVEGGPAVTSQAERLALVAEMLDEFVRLQRAAIRIQTVLRNPWLRAELRPWAEKLAGWSEAAILALTVLRTALLNPREPALPAMRQGVVDQLLTTRESFYWVSGDLIDQFIRRLLWAASAITEG